jgi:hypothetical protein
MFISEYVLDNNRIEEILSSDDNNIVFSSDIVIKIEYNTENNNYKNLQKILEIINNQNKQAIQSSNNIVGFSLNFNSSNIQIEDLIYIFSGPISELYITNINLSNISSINNIKNLLILHYILITCKNVESIDLTNSIPTSSLYLPVLAKLFFLYEKKIQIILNDNILSFGNRDTLNLIVYDLSYLYESLDIFSRTESSKETNRFALILNSNDFGLGSIRINNRTNSFENVFTINIEFSFPSSNLEIAMSDLIFTDSKYDMIRENIFIGIYRIIDFFYDLKSNMFSLFFYDFNLNNINYINLITDFLIIYNQTLTSLSIINTNVTSDTLISIFDQPTYSLGSQFEGINLISNNNLILNKTLNEKLVNVFSSPNKNNNIHLSIFNNNLDNNILDLINKLSSSNIYFVYNENDYIYYLYNGQKIDKTTEFYTYFTDIEAFAMKLLKNNSIPISDIMPSVEDQLILPNRSSLVNGNINCSCIKINNDYNNLDCTCTESFKNIENFHNTDQQSKRILIIILIIILILIIKYY